MKKSFFAPAKYKMALPGQVADVDGGLIFPAGIMSGALLRRNLTKTYPHLSRRLLDPQLYLAELPANQCRKACCNLASYPWFGVQSVESYESGELTQAAWKQKLDRSIHKIWPGGAPTKQKDIDFSISSCLAFQRDLECEAIILPSPLTTDLASSYSTELNWLDSGLSLADQMGIEGDLYASVAISDTALRGLNPYQNDLLSLIIDQVTARELDGVYLVIEQSNEQGYYCGHPNTVGSLLRLVTELKAGGVGRIVLAPIGTAGLMGISVGADTWSTGWYRGERRIKLADFQDQVGMAVPTYYSHAAGTEIHLDSDLDRIVAAGRFESIVDETPASENLVEALRAGALVSTVPEWEYRRANVTAACEHFLYAAIRETETFSRLPEERVAKECLGWIESAERVATRLYSIGGFNQRTELNHQASWAKALRELSERT